MSTRTRVRLLPAALLFAACAIDRPADTVFDDSGGKVTVMVLGDGFVRVDDRRIPLDAFLLEMRQRVRRMEPDQLSRFVVHVLFDPAIESGEEAVVASRGRDRLLRELDIMEIPQVKYL